MKNAKAYLSQVKDRKDYIKYLEQDIERLNEEATSIRGVSFVCKERTDGKLVLPEAVKIMKIKAA